MHSVSATVEGMTCGNCALTISRVLERKGATAVSANAASGEVSFNTAEDTDLNRIWDDIDALGYKVVRDDETAIEQPLKATHTAWRLPVCIALTLPLLAHMWLNWPLLHSPVFQLALATPVFIIGWWTFGKSAVGSVKHRLPNMNVLILLGATAAYVYSLTGWLTMHEGAHHYLFFETGATIITLVMTGNWLEQRTVHATSAAIDALVKLQPQRARIVMTDSIGKESIIDVEQKAVRIGDVVIVANGETVPVDGEVIAGTCTVDESMITGEAIGVYKERGDKMVGGTMTMDGSVRLRATGIGKSSVLAGIIRAVREAQAVRSPLQQLADKISAIFVPAVLGIAIITLLANYYVGHLGFSPSLMRAIAVLVISCPCAMGLATPAATAVGLGRAARNGILIKGSDTLQRLAGIKTIVFDKTGTLTTGKIELAGFEVGKGVDTDQAKAVIVALEHHSTHPIARSILHAWEDVVPLKLREVYEHKGQGVEGKDMGGNIWRVGSAGWLAGPGMPTGADVYLTKDGNYIGSLSLKDTLREDAAATIAELKGLGYRTILLSGDKQAIAEELGQSLGIDEAYGGQLPVQKQERLRALMKASPTAMVGDGINDAPALALASVGISLSDASGIAVQSAQVVLSGNRLNALPKALRLGKLTVNTIKQNLFWAFFYNVIAIPVAAFGYLSPTWGAGLMAISDVVLVINSLRLRIRRL